MNTAKTTELNKYQQIIFSKYRQIMRDNGLEIKAEFVPWSKSRNYSPKINQTNKKNLNWKVTLLRNGREIVTTDYSAGIGHCRGYEQEAYWTVEYTASIENEVETGYLAIQTPYGIKPDTLKGQTMPDPASVLWSLLMDADVLSYKNFEDWALCCGYDPDSRNAEKIYSECLKIALQLQNGLGHKLLEDLKKRFEDY